MGGQEQTGRRLTGLALAWLIGVALQLQQPALWPLASYAAIAIAAALLLAMSAWRRAAMLALGAAFVCAAALGFAGAGWRASLRLADALPTALEGRDLLVTGVVTSLPQRTPAGLRFRFDVEDAQPADAAFRGPSQLPATLAVGWYSGFHEDAALTPPQAELRAGQRWRFTLRLRQPHGNVNPNGVRL